MMCSSWTPREANCRTAWKVFCGSADLRRSSGYYSNPEETAKLFPARLGNHAGRYPWLNSGDRAYRADGEIYVTDRVKDIIIKGGRNLYPHEVEELASNVEGIPQRLRGGVGLKDEDSGTEKLVMLRNRAENASVRPPPRLPRRLRTRFRAAWAFPRSRWS